MIATAPITLADLPPEWIAERREVVLREGRALRACADSFNVECKSLTSNRWLRIGLPNGAPAFARATERDAVLAQLTQP